MVPDEILHTPRFLLRHFQLSDVEPLIELWTDSEVTRYMGGPRERTSLEQNLRATAPEKYDLWPLVERTTGHVVGHCGLLPKVVDGQSEIELVYVIARRSWGRGYATEIAEALKQHAFHALDIARLVALIDPANAASERVALKIGMHLEKEVVRPSGVVRRLYVIEALSKKSVGRPIASRQRMRTLTTQSPSGARRELPQRCSLPTGFAFAPCVRRDDAAGYRPIQPILTPSANRPSWS